MDRLTVHKGHGEGEKYCHINANAANGVTFTFSPESVQHGSCGLCLRATPDVFASQRGRAKLLPTLTVSAGRLGDFRSLKPFDGY